MKLLLIEDDEELALSLVERFREHSHPVSLAQDGSTGLQMALREDFDAIILDRMLPSLDGLQIVKSLRRSKDTPVIYLTTLDGIDDRVQGLEAGGDDYLVKPFAFAELLARVRALTRRGAAATTRLACGSLEMDLLERIVTREGKQIELVPVEYRLLECLMRNSDQVVTRKMLLERVWEIHFDPHTNVVESHISRLRTHLNAGFTEDAIQTVRGVGYRLLAIH